MKKSFGKYDGGKFKGKKSSSGHGHPGNSAASTSAAVGKQFENPPGDTYHGMTDAFKEVLGLQPSKSQQCKLPRTYRSNCMTEDGKVPDYVEKDPGPLPPEEIDDTDWSDNTTTIATTLDESKDKFKPIPTMLADKSCNFHIQPHEKLIQCPYDKSHKVLEGRVLSHLNKCRRNYIKERTDAKKVIEIGVCKYYTLHHIHNSLMADHVKSCPNALDLAHGRETYDKLHKKSLAKKNKESDTSFSSTGITTSTNTYGESSLSYDISNTNTKDIVETKEEENWELDEPVPAYDPTLKLMEGTPFFITPQGLTRSERRKFREAQRVRLLKEKGGEEKEQSDRGDVFVEYFSKLDKDDGESGDNDENPMKQNDMDNDGNVEK